jgi:hypothetical protein
MTEPVSLFSKVKLSIARLERVLREWDALMMLTKEKPMTTDVDLDGLSYELWAMAQMGPKEGIEDAARRISETLQEVFRNKDAEIERLRADAESCRKDAERMREALAMIATATTEDGCTCDNGYTPMWVAEEALAGEDV